MTWLRLEGSSRDPEVTEGLAARLADPLWTLARQWQVGEFHGEDAASPVLVTAKVASTPMTAYAAGGPVGGSATAIPGAGRPLEVLVEQEPVDDALLRLDLGWLLVSDLDEADVPSSVLHRLRSEYGFTPPPNDGLDPTGRARLELLARRAIDGLAVTRAIPQAGGLKEWVETFGLTQRVAATVRRVVGAWLAAVEEFIRVPEGTETAWEDGPLEYRFSVAAPQRSGELGLSADEYRGGTLDWYHFRQAQRRQPLGARGRTTVRDITTLPTPLRFNGMPAARFWELEHHVVSFGDMAGGQEDLVRAIVGGFAAVYGEDWMNVPCVLPSGTVARVNEVVVHDDYGQRHRIPATAVVDGPQRLWRFFEIEGDDGPDAPKRSDRRSPLLLLPPSLPQTTQGPAAERVDFKRDEIANLVWAVERRVTGGSGRPVDRDASVGPGEDDNSASELWSYVAARPVPENWIPFVPVILGDEVDGQVHLRRGRMSTTDPTTPPERLLPMGRILDPSQPMRVNEEAIPDAGLRIDRRYQRTRDASGRVHLWMGRRVRVGAEPTRRRFVTDVLRKPRSS